MLLFFFSVCHIKPVPWVKRDVRSSSGGVLGGKTPVPINISQFENFDLLPFAQIGSCGQDP